MQKKIRADELKVGMYVSALDRPWRGTPFLFQGFEITSTAEMAEIQRLCQYVYIDTRPPEIRNRRPNTPAPRLIIKPANDDAKPPSRRLDYTILEKFTAAEKPPPLYHDQATLEQELVNASQIERETRSVLYSILDDVRLGHSFDTQAAKQMVRNMVQSIIRNPDALVCLNQLKDKDEYTALHSLRVCVLALAFGRHLELTDEELNVLGMGALLHDLGKTKVPSEILNKPSRLTDSEFAVMKQHVPWGVEILEKAKGIPPGSIDVARSHHERFNGRGYHVGLQGETISLFGQIGGIVDCYDAITSDRSYHLGLSAHETLRQMYEWRSKDFHPQLIEQFIQCMGIYPIGSLVEMSTGSIGVVVSVNRQRRLRPRVALVLNAEKQPFEQTKIIDLMSQVKDYSDIEIRKVLPAGTYGINPTHYFPLTAA
jgi:putative nucleotidyltransferase with HDIG domain